MRTKKILLIFALFLLGALGTAASRAHAQSGQPPAFAPAPCPETLAIPYGQAMECGYLTVPEDHAQPDGPQIQIAVGIVRSDNPAPAPDPIIYITGGPGGSGLETFASQYYTLEGLLAQRDIIFFDHRGAGYSQPSLMCPEITGAFIETRLAYLSGTRAEAAYAAEMGTLTQTCAEALQARGINPAMYTTAQTAADVAALAQAIGYAQYNLYAISYGGKIALTIMRDHPEGIRSVLLDSPLPPQVDAIYGADPAAYAAFAQLFADCAADFRCKLFYPDLEAIYARLFAQLNETPRQIAVENAYLPPDVFPGVQERYTISVDGALLSGIVRDGLLNPHAARQQPGLIWDAAHGDDEALGSAALGATLLTPNLGAFLSALCADEAPFADPAPSAEAQAAYPAALTAGPFTLAELTAHTCEHWPTPQPDPLDNAAVTSDIPTLLLVGVQDARTPSAFARQTAETLPNSFMLEVPGRGHGTVLMGACVEGVAGRFFDNPDTRPDTACFAKLRPPAFSVSQTAVRPVTRAGALLLGALVAAGAARPTRGALRSAGRYRAAWGRSIRLHGWLPVVVPLGVMGFVQLGADYFSEFSVFLAPERLVSVLVGLGMGLQAALLFAPGDERPLEILLVTPRPLGWVVMERLAVAVGGQAVVALAGMAVVGTVEPWGAALLRWLGPVFLFGGLGIFLTLTTRRTMVGMGITLLTWFATVALGDFLVSFKPWSWPLLPYVEPDTLAAAEYALNRAILMLGGVGFALLGLRQLRDPERLLGGGGRQVDKYTGRQVDRHTSKKVDRYRAYVPVSIFRLGGVIRYELIMRWRQRLLPTLLAALVGGLLVAGLVARGRMAADLAAVATSLPGDAIRLQLAKTIVGTVFGMAFVLLLLLPPFVADTIPKDRHYGVDELLGGQPVGRGMYLAGKLLAVWLMVVGGVFGVLLAAALGAWALLGAFDFGYYLQALLTGVLPLLAYSSGMGVLLAAGQPTRRRAALVGIVFVMYYAVILPFTITGGATDILLVNPSVFMFLYLSPVEVGLYTQADALAMVGAIVGQLVLVGGFVWGRWRKAIHGAK